MFFRPGTVLLTYSQKIWVDSKRRHFEGGRRYQAELDPSLDRTAQSLDTEGEENCQSANWQSRCLKS